MAAWLVRGSALSLQVKNDTFQLVLGVSRSYQNWYELPGATRSPRGEVRALRPRYSRVRRQSSTPGVGVTTMVSPTAPRSFDTRATPRRATTRHVPAGPSTRSGSGVRRELSTGHSSGDCQSYGPHSVTIIADRSRRASEPPSALHAPAMGAGANRELESRSRRGHTVSMCDPLPLASLPCIDTSAVSFMTAALSAAAIWLFAISDSRVSDIRSATR